MVFGTWDLNFGAWIFTLTVSKTETWKLFFFLSALNCRKHGRIVSDRHGHPLVIITFGSSVLTNSMTFPL
jgi:hypothetical protein